VNRIKDGVSISWKRKALCTGEPSLSEGKVTEIQDDFVWSSRTSIRSASYEVHIPSITVSKVVKEDNLYTGCRSDYAANYNMSRNFAI
jgi:hypothetical protein